MSMGMIFFMYAGCFYFAAWLIEAGYVKPSNFDYIFRCLMGLVFGAMTAGQAGAAAPDAVAAKECFKSAACSKFVSRNRLKTEKSSQLIESWHY